VFEQGVERRPLIAATRVTVEEMGAIDFLCRWHECSVSDLVRKGLARLAEEPLVKYDIEAEPLIYAESVKAVWGSGTTSSAQEAKVAPMEFSKGWWDDAR
jgi:hypothetical protein